MTFFDQIKTQFLAMSPLLTDEEWQKFVDLFKLKTFKKGEMFIQTGQFSTEFGFIEKGLFRFFYTTFEGEEFNQTIKKDYDLIMSFTSILMNAPSNFSVQALEDTSVYLADYKNFEPFYQRHPAWQEIGRKVAEMNFIIKTRKEEQFLLYNAQERYENFAKANPDLIKRVPQLHIASYLGVSAETLNRIIKKSRES